MKPLAFLVIFSVIIFNLKAQDTDANIFGDVKSGNEHIPFASVYIEGTTIGTSTDHTGHYMLINLPEGQHVVIAKALGYETARKEIEISPNQSLEVNFNLKEEVMSLNEVVVTGTKTFKRRTESPVIVNVLESKSLKMVEACNISEGLRFQPGLRVETDCQTCNYTQLRMNGLGGGYSQILINGRPIFSPLIGLYGMEQIPANMVDRIEVVRGGGSALYGSSAIGGTVNIITKIPNTDSYNLSTTAYSINGDALDNIISGNLTMVTNKRNAGASVFVNRRYREAYDHPGINYTDGALVPGQKDNYSELPELRNNSFGANLFYKPTSNQKLELNFTSLNEYRYGGELGQTQAHLALQSEERTHNIFMGGVDYQINFNDDNSSIILYSGAQYTDRDHYTGLYPVYEDFVDEVLSESQINQLYEEGVEAHLKTPPYGYTYNTTIQAGTQFNHRLQNFFGGTSVFTVGAEYLYDDVLDSIPVYGYGTDQTTRNFGAFAQSDWKVSQNLNFLAGLRFDKHNLVDHIIASPRLSLLYTLKQNTQFRITWGTGFRAPQAFDTDMHIAFAGGGISRISLDPNLKEERSNSISTSVNYDKATERFIVGFTLEGFYTRLEDAFYLQPVDADGIGDRFVKQNSQGATVQGITLELRGNYNRKLQLETGLTLQTSLHQEPVENIEGLPAKREFLRTPNEYGYFTFLLMPSDQIDISISSVFTGKMLIAHVSPAPEIIQDQYRTTPSFTELNLRAGYTFEFANIDSGLELFGGVKNLTNVYQNDFDNGRNRDSNYVYGPALPRTFFLGLALKSL